MCVSCSTGHSFDCVGAGFCRPELFEPRGRKDVVFEVELKRELKDHRASVLVVLGKVGQRPFGFELIGNRPHHDFSGLGNDHSPGKHLRRQIGWCQHNHGDFGLGSHLRHLNGRRDTIGAHQHVDLIFRDQFTGILGGIGRV